MNKPSIVLLALSFACAGTERGGEAQRPRPSWAETTLAGLTLREKVGQLVFARADGDFLSESDPRFEALSDAAREGRIGGVIFFRGSPYETAATANRLQQTAPLPLLMASDYEWGASMRVEGATRFPMAMALGAAGASERDIELEAEVTAREARALGIQLLLNPVLDVNTNPENPVIDIRSFGEDPERVAELGSVYVRRAQAQGVLATAKHFPGHGGTGVDSHLRLPVVSEGGDELRSVALVPFRAAIDAGVAAVMPAHLAVPGLGGAEDVPATLSPELLRGVLRGELGFEGLVVSDALDMAGARESAWDGEVAVRAIEAGVDVLLMPPDPLVAHRALLRAVQRGELTEARVDASVRRILEAKERVGLHERRSVDLGALARLLANPVVGERIDALFARALTVLTNRGELLPFHGEAPPAVLLVSIAPKRHPELDPEPFAEELERRTARVERIVIEPGETPALGDGEELVLVASYGRYRLPPGLVDALNARLARGAKVVHVGFGSPYVLTALPRATALVAAYDYAPRAQRAAAAALFGEIGVSGRLPVSLSREYPLGRGFPFEPRRMQLDKVEDPEEVGLSAAGLEEAVSVLEKAVSDRATPGAVALVARRGKIALERAVGELSYDDDAKRVRDDTLYDLASLTKIVVTTTLSMIYVERGLLDLEAPVERYVPEFRGEHKDRVLVEDLLAHSGGLLWWTDLYKRFEGKSPEEAKRGYIEAICEMPLDYEPRTKTVYSDLGILLLGEILERVSGKPLDVQAEEEIFEPLGMDETLYRPPASLRDRIAPTEKDPWRGRVVRGEVHDENAFALGGVAPHAGLFSTARSLARFVQMILNGGAFNGRRLLRAETIDRFTTRAGLVPGSSRALGWDTPSSPSSSGRFFSSASFGHTGFTGTSIWVDPERELFVILLTNRVHPTRENSKLTELRPAFHDAVMRALTDVSLEPRQ